MSITNSHEEACLSREVEAEKKQAAHEAFVHDNMITVAEYERLMAFIKMRISEGTLSEVVSAVKELEQAAYAHHEELSKLDWDECVGRGE